MARIRTIKPEFFTSLTIADLTPEQRISFIGLWTHVDDEGRCVDDARLIKAAVWPLDDRTSADVEGDLQAIAAGSLIARYTVSGKRYLAVTNWAEHQKINRPTPSKFPAPSDGTPTPPPASLSPHGGLSEDSNGVSEQSREGSREGRSEPSAPDSATSPAASTSNAPSGNTSESLTSGDTNDDAASVSAHGDLTEDSLPERNREQGTGKGKKNTPPPSAGPPKGAKTDRGSRLPEDFAVTSEMAAWARENTPTCGLADHEAFCDYWRAQPGAKGRKVDWVATWRNWMRRAHADNTRSNGRRPAARPTPDDRAASIQALKHNPPADPAANTARPLNLIRGELA